MQQVQQVLKEQLVRQVQQVLKEQLAQQEQQDQQVLMEMMDQ